MSRTPTSSSPVHRPGTPPAALAERLSSLGVTLVRLSGDGQAALLQDAGALEKLVAASPVLLPTSRRLFPTLLDQPGVPQQAWPGVWLVAMPHERRRRAASAQGVQSLTAALLIGPEFLGSDQLRAVCDKAQLDFQAVVQSVDRSRLISASEVARFAAMAAWMHSDTMQLERRTQELQSLSQELAESYEELSLLYKFSSNITVNQPAEDFLSESCAELREVLNLKWLALQLDESLERLPEQAGRLMTAGATGCESQLLARIGKRLLSRLDASGQPVVIDDTTTLDVPLLSRVTSNLLMVPLVADGQTLGLIYGGEKTDGTHISSVDSKLCASLAGSISIFLENLALYGDMQGMFLGTLHALTSAIDAKDSYTRGHSERVALMSRMLAEQVGLDEATCERVYIAGLVHDVGKIGVPEAVLCKPGRLTDDEFELIKMHPEIGARILSDIRQMQDLIPGVLYHHERWDGRGYPHQLAGEAIPMFGRLICLADSFDAMSSNRTYRKSLSHEDVVAEIARCGGQQFDPELADAFVTLDFKPFHEMLESHQPKAPEQDGDGGTRLTA